MTPGDWLRSDSGTTHLIVAARSRGRAQTACGKMLDAKQVVKVGRGLYKLMRCAKCKAAGADMTRERYNERRRKARARKHA
jgi:hypothetical protein